MHRGSYVFAIVLSLAAQAAMASTVTIGTVRSDSVCATSNPDRAPELQDFRYELNRDLGRARVAVTLTTNCPSGSDELGLYDARFLVPGLSYDTATRQVVFAGERGTRVVCANVDFPRFLGIRRTRIKETGACEVSVATEVVSEDDGFQVNRREVIQVAFEARD